MAFQTIQHETLLLVCSVNKYKLFHYTIYCIHEYICFISSLFLFSTVRCDPECGHGICVPDGVCVCTDGYTGAACNIAPGTVH